MLPFFGKAHVAYIPNGYIVGLSKIPRVVDAFARRLQVQERLTVEIRNCIRDLKPLGVAVVIEAQHMCMVMRGIQKQHSIATTSAFTGEFEQGTTASRVHAPDFGSLTARPVTIHDLDEQNERIVIEQFLPDVRKGRMVILVDDEDRENEGDLVRRRGDAPPRKQSISWPARAAAWFRLL